MTTEDTKYDYKTSWQDYSIGQEENRFLSTDDLLQICDCIDLDAENRGKTSGGIPIHYDKEKKRLYVLKEEGPHAMVEGESGCKKSRTIARGSIISAALNHDSIIINDPKGELYADAKIQWLLQKENIRSYVIDFRDFDKDGVNPLSHTFKLMKEGKKEHAAMSEIDKFVCTLIAGRMGTDDPYWNNCGGELIRRACQMLARSLVQKEDGEKAFNLSSVKSFIRQDRKKLKSIFSYMAGSEPLCSSITGYNDIIQIDAEKTYSCIASSANALLSDFVSSEELLKMMSIQTFDIREFYTRPCALFLVVPDEHNAYDVLVGYLINYFYQILVETYGSEYQGKGEPPCSIKFICDEAANIRIYDLASKVSASRSRKIDWTLIFQSGRQMAEAYQKDWGTICGNCRHKLYLGSSDYEILKNISEQTGVTYLSRDGSAAPLVGVAELRRMRKERDFKDALLLTGNHIYCAQLPDYEVFDFLKPSSVVNYPYRVHEKEVEVYTPEDMYSDYREGKIIFSEKTDADRSRNWDELLKEIFKEEIYEED